MRAFKILRSRYFPVLSITLVIPACGIVDSGGSQGVDVGRRGRRVVNERTQVLIDAAAVTKIEGAPPMGGRRSGDRPLNWKVRIRLWGGLSRPA